MVWVELGWNGIGWGEIGGREGNTLPVTRGCGSSLLTRGGVGWGCCVGCREIGWEGDTLPVTSG